MPAKWLMFFSIFFSIYSLTNLYVAWRGWQALRLADPTLDLTWYVLLFVCLAAAYPLGRFAENLLPFWLSDKLTILGSYWLAAIYYLVLLTLLLDLLRTLGSVSGLLPAAYTPPGTGMFFVLLASLAIVIYGVYNANTPIIRNYEVTINKAAGTRKSLQAVMVSDIHLGKIVDTPRLTRLIEDINALNPEIVLLPGDIIDEDVDLFIDQKMAESFRCLKAPLGTYAVLGNHEYIGRQSGEAIAELRRGNVNVLRDEAIKIDDSFFLVGRDDYSRNRFDGLTRAPLADLIARIDPVFPVIVLDHQPSDLPEAQNNQVDLQLSGHTHRGQMFPNNYITQALYDIDWGYLRQNTLQVIVSCGYGTWGPPIRTGSRPEIVSILIHFKPS